MVIGCGSCMPVAASMTHGERIFLIGSIIKIDVKEFWNISEMEMKNLSK